MVWIIVLASLVALSALISFLTSYQTKRSLQSGLGSDEFGDLLSVLIGVVAIVLVVREGRFLWVPLLLAGTYQATGWIWAAREVFRHLGRGERRTAF